LEALTLTGISLTKAQARVTLHGVPDKPGVAADIFETIGEAGVFVDMIVQGDDDEDGMTSISFTTDEGELERSLEVVSQVCQKHGMRDFQSGANISKITVSGIGLRSHTQVGTILFKQLADLGINIEMIGTSELQLNAVVVSDKVEAAIGQLKNAFAASLGAESQ
ncbi:MAG: ACT domain-containing protein, partial [Novipirellula sp. JB048]